MEKTVSAGERSNYPENVMTERQRSSMFLVSDVGRALEEVDRQFEDFADDTRRAAYERLSDLCDERAKKIRENQRAKIQGDGA